MFDLYTSFINSEVYSNLSTEDRKNIYLNFNGQHKYYRMALASFEFQALLMGETQQIRYINPTSATLNFVVTTLTSTGVTIQNRSDTAIGGTLYLSFDI